MVDVPTYLRPGAFMPTIAREGDVGADVGAYTLRTWNPERNDWDERKMVDSQTIVRPGCYKVFGTGVHLILPPGYRGRVQSRSGLAAKFGVEAGAGLIDNGFHGEIGIVLYNHGDKNFVVNDGDRIAQICVEEYTHPLFKPIPVEQLPDSQRGSKGWGSSGLGQKLEEVLNAAP
jgi:dUTP pyrophosphatase